nr:hypothetical protein BaRGS_011439 [Batillaria attramentaria]
MYATDVYDVTPLYNPNVTTSTGDVKGDVITPEASFLPWDNPDNIISYVTYQEIDKLVTCAVVPPLFLLGLVTNLINCVVFWRQGLKDRMNLCLFSLAVADMLFVLCLFLMVSYCVVKELGLVTDDTWKWYVRR